MSALSFYSSCRGGDNHIGIQEQLAITMLTESYGEHIRNCCITVYVDNQGVLGATVTGSSRSPEQNILIARLWMEMAEGSVPLVIRRVESKANIADGPSRYFLDDLFHLGAYQTEVVLPKWAYSIWNVTDLV